MNLFSNFAILFLVLSCPRISRGDDSDVEDNSLQLSAGNSSKIEDSKYLVSIYYDYESCAGDYRCAGALVTMNIVFTTWTCVKDLRRKSTTVVAGSSKLHGREHVRAVSELIPSWKYGATRSRMNIAAIKVKTPFHKGPRIDNIPLCTAKLTEAPQMRVSGWGGAKKELRTSMVRVIPWGQCTPLFKRVKIREKHSMICAGGKDGAYFGGSGSPGVVNGTLCAIAVAKQKEEIFPHLYTDLSSKYVKKFVRYAIRAYL